MSGVDLAWALAGCAPLVGDAAVGLLYSPVRAEFASLRNGTLSDSKGKALDLSECFEARVFSTTGELRWLKDPHSVGDAAFVSEQATGPAGWNEPVTTQAIPFARRYLLWGNVEGDRGTVTADGWSRLHSPRIGSLAAPASGVVEGRLVLTTVEYIGQAAGELGAVHGNAAVLDERLIAIEPDGGTGR